MNNVLFFPMMLLKVPCCRIGTFVQKYMMYNIMVLLKSCHKPFQNDFCIIS